MSKLTPEQKRKLDQTESPSPPTEPTVPALLSATRDRYDRELAALQTQVDNLAEEFASRAAAIVEAGLNHSYQLARQKIGAIDISFFDIGEQSPVTIYALPEGETP